uniref:LysE family translocator n=1 Tax=Flavobacterium sp. TaxID=239 RepID=UPI00404AF356
MFNEATISFLVASVVLTISPGPDILYVLTLSVTKGFKQGFATALGLVSGILIHTSLVAFGVSALIKESEYLFFAIKFAGSFYLLWLAFLTFKAPANINLSTQNSDKNLGQLFRQGFLMNVLNPKVTLFFLAFLPGFVNVNAPNAVFQFYQLGFIFMAQALLIFGLVSWFAAKLSTTIRKNKALGLYFKWIQIVVFILIAVFILWD